MANFLEKVKRLQLSETSTNALLLFSLNGFLVFAFFLPNLSDINPWDEAAYYHAGMSLIEHGDWPQLAGNPLTTLFFGLTYLPFTSSIHWMIYSISLGRIILFALLWLGTYLMAKEVEDFASPLVVLGFLFVTPLTLEMLRFPSDPLFAALSALSLWQLLKFRKHPELIHLIFASSFMALAGLARNDGLVQFVILVVLSAVLAFRKTIWWRSLGSVTIPFLVIVGGYVLLLGVSTGDFNLGVSERTYSNFESGQQIIYSGPGELGQVIESRIEARRIFGTREENKNSVLRAISNNPGAYIDRLIATIQKLPTTGLEAYGKRFTVVIFYFVIRGMVALIRKKQYLLLVILVLWPLHLLTGFIITLIRSGHLQFPFYVVFVLASIGLTATISNLGSQWERLVITIALLGFSGYGLLDNKLAIFYGAALTLIAIWIIIFSRKLGYPTKLEAFLVVLAVGIIVRGGYPSPKLPVLGVDPKEQAVVFLSETFQEGTFVGAGSPGVVWAAKMKYAGLNSSDVPVNRSSEEFIDWMRDQGIEIVYIDHSLYNSAPRVWELIEPQIGLSLDRLFILERGNFQILEFIEN